MTDDRYARTTFRGKAVDKWTAQALAACERDLGYELTVVQGSFNGTAVAASAGTHAGGGVVDLAPFDAVRKVMVLRSNGFAAWHRLPSEGPWGEHIHAVLIGDESAAASAQRQVESYRAGRNGLANGARDNGPKVTIREFTYRSIPERKPGMNSVSYGRMLIEAGLTEWAKAKKRPMVKAAAALVRRGLTLAPKS
jgi:hypothetical protein